MRITDALKPVTDALAAAGMSLESATYKDGKIQATLSTEAPKATGKSGSSPEHPPEGYKLLPSWGPGPDGQEEYSVWLAGHGAWLTRKQLHQCGRVLTGYKILAIAVPIAPKPEPVKLSDQEKIVGWRGPTGFRLQTFQNREVQCSICKKTIKAGERLARWRSKFPEKFDQFVIGKQEGSDEFHHVHVDCLYRMTTERSVGYRRSRSFSFYMDKLSISFHMGDVPQWLQEKREKFDKQNGAP